MFSRLAKFLTCLLLLTGAAVAIGLQFSAPQVATLLPPKPGTSVQTPSQGEIWTFRAPRYRPSFLLKSPKQQSRPSFTDGFDSLPPLEEFPWAPAEPTDDTFPTGSPNAPEDDEIAVGEATALPGLAEFGNARITGEVFDFSTIDPLGDVSVTLAGRPEAVITGEDGRFEITNLPSGSYQVEFNTLGYSIERRRVTTREGFPGEVRVGLRVKAATESAVTILEEEPVIGEYQEPSSSGDFILDIEAAPTVSSGLSEEDFAKENVSDAGEAVGKVSGANIVGGKFAVVRGLADRYVTTTFNGAQISSSEPSRKAVPLDLFPTSTLRGINVAKTYDPSLSGDFGGASIDIATKAFPDEQVISLKFEQEWNPENPDRFLIDPNQELGFLGGIDDPRLGSFPITDPETGFLFAAPTAPDGSPETEAQAAAARNAFRALLSANRLVPKTDSPENKRSYGITLGDSFQVLPNVRWGFLINGGQKNEDDFAETVRFVPGNGGREFDQRTYSRSREWNLYASTGLEIGENHNFNALYFRKNISEQTVTEGLNGTDPNGVFSGAQTDPTVLDRVSGRFGVIGTLTSNFFELEPLERDLQIFQLSGESKFGERGPKVRWAATQSDALENRPNSSFFERTTINFDAEALVDTLRQNAAERLLFGPIRENSDIFQSAPPARFSTIEEAVRFLQSDGTIPQTDIDEILQQIESEVPAVDPERPSVTTVEISEFSEQVGAGNLGVQSRQRVEESTSDLNFSVELPWYFSEEDESRGVSLSLGAASTERRRSTRGNRYALVFEQLSAFAERTGGLDAATIRRVGEQLALDPTQIDELITGFQRGAPFYLDDTLGNTFDNLNLINNVDATQRIEGQHIALHLFAGDTFARGGLRFESEDRSARILAPRPNLSEDRLNPPLLSTDEILPSLTLGTSFLDGHLQVVGAWSQTVARPTFFEFLPTRSIDLATGEVRAGEATLQNSQIENFDLSFDYSPFENLNFRLGLFLKKIDAPIIQERNNIITSFSNGQEGTIRGVELDFDWSQIGPFSLSGNVTLIDAELLYEVETAGEQELLEERFPFQPNYIANLNLGYLSADERWRANVIANFTSSYITILRSAEDDPNLEQNAQYTVDFVVSRKFGKNKNFELTAGVENLLASDVELTFLGGGGNDGRTSEVDRAQRVYFVGGKYSF